MSQISLFQQPDPVEESIQRNIQRGQRITPWIVSTMKSWVARKVHAPKSGKTAPLSYESIGMLPLPCDCHRCGEPALIFPPEEGAPRGYCICPVCSFAPRQQTA